MIDVGNFIINVILAEVWVNFNICFNIKYIGDEFSCWIYDEVVLVDFDFEGIIELNIYVMGEVFLILAGVFMMLL